MNVGQLLTIQARKYPDRIALIWGERRFSYREFNERANRFANFLLRFGLKKGEKVATLLRNSNPLLEVFLGTAKVGGVFTPINFRLTAEEVAHFLDYSDARIFIFGEEFSSLVAAICPRLEKVEIFVSTGEKIQRETVCYETLLEESKRREPKRSVAEKDECQLLYTSGTTGRPKGAILTHGNVLWNLFNTLPVREDREGEVSLVIGPLYHAAALNNHFIIRLALAGTSILIDHFDPPRVMEMIEKESVNVISGAPAMYHMLLNFPGLDQYDTRSITKCTTGAAILPEETKKRLMELFPNSKGICDVYGTTEASPNITILRATDSFRKQACVGLPVPFTEVRIVDDRDQDVPRGEVGELICQGPNIMKGYYKDPQATREALKGGWLHTGDVARMDEEGFVYIVDRKKDLIISGGENIYPREIEEVLFRHPKISDAAVIGIPDPVWGEAVRAFIVPREGETIGEEEIVEFCKRHLASYKKPKSVKFVESIPRNPSGKVLKTLLRTQETSG